MANNVRDSQTYIDVAYSHDPPNVRESQTYVDVAYATNVIPNVVDSQTYIEFAYKLGSAIVISLACPSAVSGTVGIPYSSALVVTGGTPPFTFSITSGSLPPGLTLNVSTGVISGTPTTAGSFGFSVQVIDSLSDIGTNDCSITIFATIALVCPTGIATQGIPYSSPFVVIGGTGTFTFSITAGALPPGLTLDASTGIVSGTPTSVGSFAYTGKVVDSMGHSASTSCSIQVLSPGVLGSCFTT